MPSHKESETTTGPTPEMVLANLTVFGRRLREVGIPVGPDKTLDLLEALEAIGMERRADVYFAMRATVASRPEHMPIFDREFARFWDDLRYPAPAFEEMQGREDEEAIGSAEPGASDDAEDGESAQGEDTESGSASHPGAVDERDDDAHNAETVDDNAMAFSAREALRKKDFAQFTLEEMQEARKMIDAMTWRLGTRMTRRMRKAKYGELIDQRATMRSSLRQGGVPVELKWRKRTERMRPLVLICDISGSMDRYARMLLRFVHALEHGLDSVEVFVFGTRLTRITRELRRRDVDQAIADVVSSVDDWSGGTRIGEAVKTFNYQWSRRVLRSGATVVMISDGWDRGDPQLLGQEMARLQRSCRRLIWLNPLLGAPGYQPLTAGIHASLPYIDHFLPVHNVESLEALALLLEDVGDSAPLRSGAAARRRAVV